MDRRRRRLGAAFWCSVALLFTGCGAPLIEPGQPSASQGSLRLSAVSPVGQSFMAYQGGLQGVELRLAPQLGDAPSGKISFQLRRRADAPDILASGTLDGSRVTGESVRVDFPPQSAARLQDFFLSLRYEGSGGYDLQTGPASAYPNGAAYLDGKPQESQLSFRLLHDPLLAALGVTELFGQWLVYGAAAAALLVLPGLALLLSLPPASRASAGKLDLVFLAPSLSAGVYPLLIMFTGLLGLRLGPLYAWIPAGLSILILAPRAWRSRSLTMARLKSKWKWPSLHQVILAGVIVLIVFSRLWPIRALEAPMWRDSYQHSVLTQLLLERGGLFDDWRPYADMLTLTYHIGFHSVSAAFGWMTGQSGAQSVLWMGQFLNIAAVLVLYPVARKMTRSPWAGTIALAFAGLVSVHPGFYVNWGRYTQLAGQVVLPGLIWLIWTTIESSRERPNGRNLAILVGLAGLAWAGLALSHYRILILAVVFMAVTIPTGVFLLKLNRTGLVALAAGSALGAALFLPWFLRASTGTLTSTAADLLATPASQASDFVLSYNGGVDMLSYYPAALRLGIALVTGLALLKRNGYVAAILVWMLAVLAATNPQAFGWGGAGIITNFALTIFGYIPAAVLVGLGLAELISFLEAVRWRSIRLGGCAFLFCAGLVLAANGFRERLSDIHPEQYALFLRPDKRAADWIKQNTRADARVLVNSYAIYDGSLISGSDGGWWLPLMAMRATTQPPISYSMERLPEADYIARTAALPIRVRREGLTEGAMAELKSRGITHIYIGQAHFGGDYMLDPEELRVNPDLDLILRQDRVWIFELRP